MRNIGKGHRFAGSGLEIDKSLGDVALDGEGNCRRGPLWDVGRWGGVRRGIDDRRYPKMIYI